MSRAPGRPELALALSQRDQGCVAPRLGGTSMDCWGRDRWEHVKPEARMSKRADDCLCQVVTLCQGHTEDGARAGFVWATANREPCRDYLATFGYGPHVDGHLQLILEGGTHVQR